MRKTKLSIIILFCLALSSCAFNPRIHNYSLLDQPRYAYSSQIPPALTPDNIKITSYNIRLCNNIEQAISLFKTSQDIKDSDIIFLQEMCPEGTKKIAQELNLNYVYYPSGIHPENKKDFGNAILSKWPIEKTQKILLPYIKEDRFYKLLRIAVGADIKIGANNILVFCTHLGVLITTGQRKAQLKKILESIPPENKYCIIAGDFNTYNSPHIRAINEIMEQYKFLPASQNIKWTYKYWYLFNKKISLDHIFTKGFKLSSSGIVPDRAASDHLPIWAELKLE